MNSENQMTAALIAGIASAFLFTFIKSEKFCYGNTWSKCGISKCMNERKNGNLML